MATKYNIIVILGPTASGKTSVAAHLAARINGEIISADSRQVYKSLNLGTGKDYNDYLINREAVPYHLIDIAEPGYQYNVYEYQQDFLKAYSNITGKGKMPILCGGTGLYIEAALEEYKLIQVPVNVELRENLEKKDLNELAEMLSSYRNLHNTTDITQKKRAIRAIEIEEYYKTHSVPAGETLALKPLYIGVKFDRLTERQRITKRLNERLNEGMVDEVRNLLDNGTTPEQLIYYGLEYKFITRYIIGEISFDEMFALLNTAIHQFAKRQMTWFRRMERKGTDIHWLDGLMPVEQKIDRIVELYK